MITIVPGVAGVAPIGYCLERTLVYCALGAYRTYDLRGAALNDECDDAITPEHVGCINSMSAHSPLALWAPFIPGTDLLASLPSDESLLTMAAAEWEATRPQVETAIQTIAETSGIALAGATKMLALKRPRLIPPCDAQLVELFDVDATLSTSGKAIALMEAFRWIAQQDDNMASLEAIQEGLALREMFGRPINLSTTRILEVLFWMATHEGFAALWPAMGWA